VSSAGRTAAEGTRVAVATTDGKNVDSGFGNASRFDIYDVSGGDTRFVRTVHIDTTKQVVGSDHRGHIENIADRLNDCSLIVVKEIGEMPSRLLEGRGKTVRTSSGTIGRGTFEAN
jgi:nitrogen fixation protein NifB